MVDGSWTDRAPVTDVPSRQVVRRGEVPFATIRAQPRTSTSQTGSPMYTIDRPIDLTDWSHGGFSKFGADHKDGWDFAGSDVFPAFGVAAQRHWPLTA